MSRAFILTLFAAGCRFGFDDYSGQLGDRDGGVDTSALVDAMETRIVFTEGPNISDVTTDTTLDEARPMMNAGGLEDLSMLGSTNAVQWALMRFDISKLTPGTIVVRARLQLTRVIYGDDSPGEMAVYPMLEAWDELAATWQQRVSGQAWSTVGGTRGAEVARVLPDAGLDLAFDLPASLVQGWVDDVNSNHGVAVGAVDLSSDAHYHLASREAIDRATCPQLVIDVLQ